jgi:hypothetical protein
MGAGMAVYFQATIELRAERVAKFYRTMETILPIVEKAGWKLAGAYTQRTGRLHTVIDLWELEDLNHYDRGLKALGGEKNYAEIAAALAECIERETTVFLDRAPYMR